MPSSRATKPGTRKLSDVARLVVKPEGIKTTGWHDVEIVCKRMGLEYDEWQKGVGRIALAKRANGNLAAMIGGVGMSLPRQVGKTHIMAGIIFALCVLRPGTLVIWSAHHSKTHEETFLAMQGFAERHKVRPFVSKVYTGSGDEEVRFHNGSRILFGARERGFGRGIPGVDILVFDEAQILSERALDAILATMNVSRFGLAFYTGTPPRPDDMSESFARMRAEAYAGTLKDAAWIECGADPDADPDDREQWAIANPSFPNRTPAESILRLRGKLTEDSFKREALGIWNPAASKGVIPGQSWMDQEDQASIAAGRFALGIEVGPDLAWASVAFAGQRPSDDWHIELDDDQHTRGRGVAWLTPSIENLVAKNPEIRAVVADVGGPIKPLLLERNGRYFLKRDDGTLGVEITPMKVAELGAGCSLVLSGIVTGSLFHIGQPQLTAAALAAGKRPLGDTAMWVWSRKAAESDITPIQAATYALIGAQMERPKKPGRSTSNRTSQGRRAVVLA
jgi:hypothetical protein